jgi:hypothetical protein
MLVRGIADRVEVIEKRVERWIRAYIGNAI